MPHGYFYGYAGTLIEHVIFSHNFSCWLDKKGRTTAVSYIHTKKKKNMWYLFYCFLVTKVYHFARTHYPKIEEVRKSLLHISITQPPTERPF